MCLISSRVAESGEEGASAGMQQEGSAGDGGGLARGCRILVIDSLHLVVETLPFLEELQARYALSRAKEPYKRALLNPLQKSPTPPKRNLQHLLLSPIPPAKEPYSNG